MIGLKLSAVTLRSMSAADWQVVHTRSAFATFGFAAMLCDFSGPEPGILNHVYTGLHPSQVHWGLYMPLYESGRAPSRLGDSMQIQGFSDRETRQALVERGTMKGAIRAIHHGLIGFGLVWLPGAAEECTLLQRASAQAFSENAQRIELSEPLSAELLDSCVAPSVVLYCDLGEQNDLKGVWLGSKANAPVSMISGSFLTADQSRSTAHVCTAGRQAAQNAIENAGKREIEIAGNDYALTGVASIADLATPLDDMLFLPVHCACEQFEAFGSDARFRYTADGSASAVSSTLSALADRGIQIQVQQPHIVTLEHAYSQALPVSTWYVSMFAVVCGILVIFIWFEVRDRAKDILAYQSSGANFFQMVCVILGRPLLVSYLALAAGEVVAWAIWIACVPGLAALGAILAGVVVTGICVLAGTLLAVLAVRHAHNARPTDPASGRIRRVLFAFLTVCSAFLLVFVSGFISMAGVARRTQDNLEARAEMDLHSLVDPCSPNEFDAFFNDPGSLPRVKALHTELCSRTDAPLH